MEHLILAAWRAFILQGRRLHAEQSHHGLVLRSPLRQRISLVLLFLLLTFIFSWAAISLHKENVQLTTPGIILLSVSCLLWSASLYGALSAMLERVEVSELYIRRRSVFGQSLLLWTELERIVIAERRESVLLIGRGETKVRLSIYLDGLLSLLTFMEELFFVSPHIRNYLLQDGAIIDTGA